MVKEHVDVEEDLKFSDETRQDVVGIPMTEYQTSEEQDGQKKTGSNE